MTANLVPPTALSPWQGQGQGQPPQCLECYFPTCMDFLPWTQRECGASLGPCPWLGVSSLASWHRA